MTGLSIVLSNRFAYPEVGRGAERYVHELAAALTFHGHRVRVLATTAGPAAVRDEVLGVPVRRMRLSGLTRDRQRDAPAIEFAARCAAAVLPSRVDVWHANTLYDAAAAVLVSRLRPRLRSVVTLHGPAGEVAAGSRPRRDVLRVAGHADELVCVSAAAARDARPLAVSVIPPGVDTRVFTPGGPRATTPTLLYVGALDVRRKNVGRLLAAAAEVPEVEVWLAGPGDSRPLIEAAPAEVRDRVRVLGPLRGEDLVAVYRAAWATALVSEREVFGMTIVESLACGTPALVLADGWGPQEIVSPGTGVAAPATKLAQGIRKVLELARQPATAVACREAAREYDWRSVIAPRLLEVYLR